MGFFIAHVLQCFRRTGDLREIERFLRHRPAVVDHIVDLIGVGNDHFPRPFLAEVGKFSQHLVGRAQVEVGLEFRILEALASHEDFPVNLVFGVHEMSIAGATVNFPRSSPSLRIVRLMSRRPSSSATKPSRTRKPLLVSGWISR